MNWIEKIRNKPYEEKIKLLWMVIILATVILIGIWVVSSRFGKNSGKDTTLFDALGKGITDVKNNYKK